MFSYLLLLLLLLYCRCAVLWQERGLCEHAVSEYCTGKLWYLPHRTKLRSRLKWDESLCVCQRLRTGREVHESLSRRRHSLLEEVQSIVIVEQQNETPRRHHAGTLRECARRGRTRSASTENCELGGDVELGLPRLARWTPRPPMGSLLCGPR